MTDDPIISNLDMLPILLKADKEVRHIWMQGSDIDWYVIIGIMEMDELNVLVNRRHPDGMLTNCAYSKRWVNSMNLSLQPEGFWALA